MTSNIKRSSPEKLNEQFLGMNMNLIKYLLFFILLENTVAFAQGSLGSFGPQTSKRNTKQFEDSLRLFQIAESFATRAMNPCKVLRTRKMKEKMVGEFKKNYNSNLKHEIDKNLALAIKIIN
ncbi:MAG: hypothetical protein HON90_05430, partial [Halobacteriovoraceae bacterium]|nr:hypothetical protein [Halobacteriovoraceae bacterium]